MTNFEDTGQYYANEEMQKEFIVLSMNSGLVYNTEDVEDVKIIKKTTDEFYTIAKADIKNGGRFFYGEASVYTCILTCKGRLCWEF